MLSQLVYVSNRSSNCTQKEIDKILISCEKNNPKLNITGVLLYSDKKFIQLVEGDVNTITNLYDKIREDKRHSNTMMISFGPIKEKSFPSWHMAAKSFSGDIFEFKSNITKEDKVIFKNMLEGNEQKGQKVLTLLQKFF